MKQARRHLPLYGRALARRGRGHIYINGTYMGRGQLNRLPSVDRRAPPLTITLKIPYAP